MSHSAWRNARAIPLNPAADQTSTSSPLTPWRERYSVKLEQLQTRKDDFPTLQSFTVGQTESGEWVMFGGRTNGRHGFLETDDGKLNFPPSHQNSEVWVYNPATDTSWSKPWSESGLSQDIQLSLSTTNGGSFQSGDTLFYVGGYVYDRASQSFSTRNRLSAIDLGDVASWVKGESGTLANNAVLSIAGEPLEVSGKETHFFAVTGGEMLPGRSEGQALLIFGQDFEGGYGNISMSSQIYTSQVRNFNINYNQAAGHLSYTVNSISAPNRENFLRRDLNIVNQLTKDRHGNLVRDGVALAGVFYNGDVSDGGVWTVPAKIDLLTGLPTMANPDATTTFRQGFNAYSAANLGLYSARENSQTNLIFGGISALTLDPEGQPFYNTNNPYPFTSQIAAVKRNSDGTWRQSLIGSFPDVREVNGDELTFGANASFIPIAEGSDWRVRYLADGVLDLDWLKRTVFPGRSALLGYVVGGIANVVNDDFNNPSDYGATISTRASGEIFKVIYTGA